jgi:hypothetical protein
MTATFSLTVLRTLFLYAIPLHAGSLFGLRCQFVIKEPSDHPCFSIFHCTCTSTMLGINQTSGLRGQAEKPKNRMSDKSDGLTQFPEI